MKHGAKPISHANTPRPCSTFSTSGNSLDYPIRIVIDSISIKSTNSLQPEVKCDDGASKGNEDDGINDQHDIALTDEKQSTSGQLETKYSPKAIRKSIPEKTARVCDAVDDIECLKEAVEDLERIYNTPRNHLPKENGLLTRISHVTKMDYHKVSHKPLPRRTHKIPKPSKSNDEDPVFIDLTKVGNFKNYFCKVSDY